MLKGLLSSFDLNHFNTRPSFSKKEVGTGSEREVCTHFVDSPVEEYVHTVAAELSGPYIIISSAPMCNGESAYFPFWGGQCP